jgi:hypothetical protein
MVSHSSIARAQPATGSIANSGVVSMLRETGSRQTVPFSKHTSSFRATIIQRSTNPEHSSMRGEGFKPSRRRQRISEANNRSARLATLCPPMANDDRPVSDHVAHDGRSCELTAVSISHNGIWLIMLNSRIYCRAATGSNIWQRALLCFNVQGRHSASNIINFEHHAVLLYSWFSIFSVS